MLHIYLMKQKPVKNCFNNCQFYNMFCSYHPIVGSRFEVFLLYKTVSAYFTPYIFNGSFVTLKCKLKCNWWHEVEAITTAQNESDAVLNASLNPPLQVHCYRYGLEISTFPIKQTSTLLFPVSSRAESCWELECFFFSTV